MEGLPDFSALNALLIHHRLGCCKKMDELQMTRNVVIFRFCLNEILA